MAKPIPSPDPHRPSPSEEDPGEESRGRVNLVAFLFVLALVLCAAWAIQALRASGELQTCLASGRHDCVDLLHPDRAR